MLLSNRKTFWLQLHTLDTHYVLTMMSDMLIQYADTHVTPILQAFEHVIPDSFTLK